MADLLTSVPARALAVYAHPDDPEISCGGTLAAWAAAGCVVQVLICTRGEKGAHDPGTDVEKLAKARAAEMKTAGRVLGVAGHEQLPIDDGELENTAEVRGMIVAAIRRLTPEVVVCPDPTAVFFGSSYFNHHDHRQIGWATLDAVAPAASNPLYFRDSGSAHHVREVLLSGTLQPDVWVDIEATVEAKIEAVACHASQLEEGGAEWVDSLVRRRAEEVGRAAGVSYAEGFRRLTFSS